MRPDAIAMRMLCSAFLLGMSLMTGVVEAGSWSRWMSSDCYRSIEYRVRYMRPAGSERHEWIIEIRNQYREAAHFRWVLAASKAPKPRVNNEMNLRAGGHLRRNSITEAGSREQVRLYAANLRLGGKNGADRACDVSK